MSLFGRQRWARRQGARGRARLIRPRWGATEGGEACSASLARAVTVSAGTYNGRRHCKQQHTTKSSRRISRTPTEKQFRDTRIHRRGGGLGQDEVHALPHRSSFCRYVSSCCRRALSSSPSSSRTSALRVTCVRCRVCARVGRDHACGHGNL